MANFKEEIAKIRAFAFDVDGVFTNCQIFVDASGEHLRQYNAKDSLAVYHAVQKGYPVAIISRGKGRQLQSQMEALGVKYIYLQKDDKTDSLANFADRAGVALDEILYMGDDYPDIAPMRMARLGVAPADGADDVRAVSHYVSKFKGGEGCVRDVIEQVLRARDDWFSI